MKIVIAGAGEVGTHLAKMLSNEDQDIILVDSNQGALDNIDSKYNLMTCLGSTSSINTLRDIGVGGCDLLIAVTPYETKNITTASIAKALGAKKTVARIDNFEFTLPFNRKVLSQVGVDYLIYPENLAANEIAASLEHNWARYWGDLQSGRLLIIGVKIRSNSQLAGCMIRNLPVSDHHFHVVAIKHGLDTIIPSGSDYIQADDIAYFITTSEYVDEVRDLCGKVKRNIDSVVIVGASRIAARFALQYGDHYKIKIIDNDLSRCEEMAAKLPHCEIVYGDARNVDTLRENNIYRYDAFLALTDSSENNILLCLTAKEFDVPKTVADVENLQFFSQAEKLGIGTIINKKLLAASRVFKILIDADADNSKCLALADAEVAEIEVAHGAKITKGEIKTLKLPYGMTLGAYTRGGECHLVDGNTLIQGGDLVVVFCISGFIHKIEKWFN